MTAPRPNYRKNHWNWKGGRRVSSHGRGGGMVLLVMPDHPKATKGGLILESRLFAERALGHLLPAAAQVHHVNGVGTDNRPGNLVICEDQLYHRLLHRRTDSLHALGSVNGRMCHYCKQWDLNLTISGPTAYHKACHASYEKQRKLKKHEEAKAKY